jgi:hypothetical protein
MFSTLRTRFGIPGVISVIALVFAMFGGAYAASNSSGGGKATASAAKGKPGPRGKTGKTGPAGPQGPAGPTGPAGPAGAKGDAGAPGAQGNPGAPGTPGTNGTSATTTSFSGAEHGCTAGGVVVKSASPETAVCNGKDGGAGGGVLPPEGTETGVWSFSSVGGGAEAQYVPISFAIPLAKADAEAMIVKVLAKGVSNTPDCPGTTEEPKAEPGVLCVYASGGEYDYTFAGTAEGVVNPVKVGEPFGVGQGGGLLAFGSVSAGKTASGTFAVTAPLGS